MAPILFAWPMTGDAAELSGGAWDVATPLEHLQSRELAQVARSSSAAQDDTVITADFGAGRAVSVVALVRHNLQKDAQWRIVGSNAADFSAPVYDSGWLLVWPEQWAPGALPAGHPNAATRKFTNAQIAALNPPRDAVHVLDEATARYWRVELDDETNTAGYVEAGRLVLAPRFQPSYNFSIGAEFGWDDGTTAERSMSRAKFFDVKPKARTLALSFQNLPHVEAVQVFGQMLEDLGIVGQVYVVTDPDAAENLQRQSFLATVRQLAPIAYTAALFGTVPVVLDEVL